MKTKRDFSDQVNSNSFINREEELTFLENLYERTKISAQFLILYGKRRVGKTELIKKYCQDKPFLYFLATRGSSYDLLKTLTEIITAYFKEEFLGKNAFGTFRKLFDYLGKKLKDKGERIVIVFDEFPYLTQSDKAMSSYFQYGWDEQIKNTNAFLVLLGSSISMMYKQTLSKKSPLYARRTAQWLLQQFTFKQSKKFYNVDDFEKIFSFYAITGGIPAYLKEFNAQKSFKQNIIDAILTKGSFLNIEPELLLNDEFNEPNIYMTILKAIGLGSTKYSDLLNNTGLPNNILPAYLSTLLYLRLIKKEVPVTEKIPQKSKKGIYSLADNFLRFYFSFVFPYSSLVESGQIKTLFDKNKEVLIKLVAKTYEETSIEFIKNIIKKGILPNFEQLGRWWDKTDEIDLVGLNSEQNSILFAEAKWNSSPLDVGVLNDLRNKAARVIWGKQNRKEYYALLAKGGFSKGLIDKAKKERVILIHEDQVI
ncbi:hypothetical protein A2153_02830 [Candidatus Gottesmanbacteria bacterium RBG_16_38_7b]|uniref:ATPase n=1 Tax=Candidatus Gottesmanbacteria bacterium RBG_16_38_7b TaxID=1798372 RepID=A0A1F5YFQ1_9BACT|nr:MAG: hypothetical protein A2153_02830 [Candidatus Gottesmanbacteria bacterium RBG_16_38_7b]